MKKYLLVVLFCFSFYSFGYDIVDRYPEFIEYHKVSRITYSAPDGQSYLFLAEYWYRRRKMRLFSNKWKPLNSDDAVCKGLDGKTYSFSDLDADLNGEVSGEEWENFQPPPDFGVDTDGDGWADRDEKYLGMTVGKYDSPSLNNVAGVDNLSVGDTVIDRYTGETLGQLILGRDKAGLLGLGLVHPETGKFVALSDVVVNGIYKHGSAVDKFVLDWPNGQEYPPDGSNNNPTGSGGGSSGSGGSSLILPGQNKVTNPDIDNSETPVNTDNSDVVSAANELIRANREFAKKEAERDKVISQQIYNQSNIMLDGNDILNDINTTLDGIFSSSSDNEENIPIGGDYSFNPANFSDVFLSIKTNFTTRKTELMSKVPSFFKGDFLPQNVQTTTMPYITIPILKINEPIWPTKYDKYRFMLRDVFGFLCYLALFYGCWKVLAGGNS